MKTLDIALYPGDGIGIDVTAEAVKALQAVAQEGGFGLKLTELDWGQRYWKRTGKVAPDDYLTVLADHPLVYLGALGDPANVPDHISIRPLIEMRQRFDQYACVRPATLFPGTTTPLANRQPAASLLQLFGGTGHQHDTGAFLQEQLRRGLTNATCCPGDDRHLAVKSLFVLRILIHWTWICRFERLPRSEATRKCLCTGTRPQFGRSKRCVHQIQIPQTGIVREDHLIAGKNTASPGGCGRRNRLKKFLARPRREPGKRKEAGHYSGLFTTTLKIFV